LVALLDTAAPLGEVLSLQWKDLNLDKREFVIGAEKSETRTARIVPISTRLAAELELRRLNPAGEDHAPDAFAFGDELGRKTKSLRTARKNATDRAGLTGRQMRDLRHEAGSRFEEAGVAISYVSKILGHTNVSTTSRYPNIHKRGLHLAMQQLEENRPSVAQPLHTDDETSATVPQPDAEPADKSPTIQ